MFSEIYRDMRLLREWVRIILEGYKDNQKILIIKFYENRDEIKGMNPKMINWFIRRFGNNPTIKEIHPFRDCIQTIKQYDKKAAGLSQKYNTNEYFRSLVDKRFPEKSWSNLADYTNMTIDQMEGIIGLSERKKPRFAIENSEPDRSDFLGKFGPWNLWMPTTKENSTKIAGYDPETLEPKTTWCTARVTGSNLFYNYVGQGIILFYVIKDNPQSSKDWLSVGFVEGEPVLEGEDGHVSVDRDNNGLTEKNLKSILGSYYDKLMTTMEEKADEISGEHPAKKKIEEAAKSLFAYQNFIKGLGKEEQVELTDHMFDFNKKISPEILIYLSDHSNKNIRQHVARNRETPSYILEKLANDKETGVICNVLNNLNTPASAFEKFVDHELKSFMACSPATPTHILDKLANDPEDTVKESVAFNSNTSHSTLEKLGNNKNFSIRKSVANNRNTPAYILEKLADDVVLDVKNGVADNPNTSVHILEKLANDVHPSVRLNVACNSATSASILEKLSNDEREDIIASVARNRNTPVYILEKLSDNSKAILSLACSTNTPVHILEKLSDNKNGNVRRGVARNRNTPIHVLEKLSNDHFTEIRFDAQRELLKRKQLTELRKLIRRLI